MNEQQTRQRGGWFRRKGRDTATTPTAPQAGSSGKFAQWLNAVQERMDNANRTRDLANRLNGDLAGILQTCAAQQQALGQRNMRTQVQLSMSLGRLTGIVRQFEATRTVCAYLLQATSPQLPAVSATLADGSANGANGATATLAAPASPSRPLFAAGNPSGPLSAPVVRNLGRGGYKRMARDLQQLYRETEQATRGILHPIQSQGIHLPEVNALANALAALEPLMTWLNQRCEQLTATYCSPSSPSASESGNSAGQRPDFWG